MATWQILVLIFLLLLISVLYYLSVRKKNEKPFYLKPFWHTEKPHPEQEVKFSVFLIGDAGAPALTHDDPNLSLLRKHLLAAGKDSAVFFLGDNVYPAGMPEPSHHSHEVCEKRLAAQLKILKDYPGRVCFLSGNHDWNKGRKGGLAAVKRQQAYVEAYLNSEQVYLPRHGCPGPVELNINDDLTIIVINTQWWVHNETRPIGKSCGCTVDSEHEFFIELDQMLHANRHKKILVAAHHPLYSKAIHGGKFDIKQHLFPLTAAHKKLYLPLPVAGSLYPIYRKYIGAEEDMSHPRYRRLRKRLLGIFCQYDNLIYAAGHDHNLQYIKKHNQHYIVSGAGSKVAYVKKGSGAYFTHAHKGFFRLDFYHNGDVWLEALEPQESGKGIVAFRKEIIKNN